MCVCVCVCVVWCYSVLLAVCCLHADVSLFISVMHPSVLITENLRSFSMLPGSVHVSEIVKIKRDSGFEIFRAT
jgi:hypothetical protein